MNPTSVYLSEQFNDIDKRICSLQRKAEKRVGTSPFILPWSPEICHMKFKLEFIKKILKATPFLIAVHLFNKCSQYNIDTDISNVRLLDQYKKDKESYKNMVLNADEIRELFLQKRSDFHSYHNNTSSSTIIKRIIQAEKI